MKCPKCQLVMMAGYRECPKCGQSLLIAPHQYPTVEIDDYDDDWYEDDDTGEAYICEYCNGTGFVEELLSECPNCDGEGYQWWLP